MQFCASHAVSFELHTLSQVAASQSSKSMAPRSLMLYLKSVELHGLHLLAPT